MFKGKILFIGAHPDDIELGCSGVIMKLNKKNVVCVTLSGNTRRYGNRLIKEHDESMKTLGIKKRQDIIYSFETRNFDKRRQDICDLLWKLKKKFNPNTVFTHLYDLHQDHQVVHNESLRAFKEVNLIAYKVLASSLKEDYNLFVELNRKELRKKLLTLSKYRTYKNLDYFNPKNISNIEPFRIIHYKIK